MTEIYVMQGRRIQPGEFLQVRELVANHPEWSRYRLSRELCVLLDLRTATGQQLTRMASPKGPYS